MTQREYIVSSMELLHEARRHGAQEIISDMEAIVPKRTFKDADLLVESLKPAGKQAIARQALGETQNEVSSKFS
jgi:hypothetical protein